MIDADVRRSVGASGDDHAAAISAMVFERNSKLEIATAKKRGCGVCVTL